MNKNIFSKKRAFTLVETIVSLAIIVFVASLTVCAAVNSEDYKLKKLKIVTYTTYNDLTQAFTQILIKNTDNMNLSKMHGITDDAKENSELLKNYFMENMVLHNEPCDKLIKFMGDEITEKEKESFSCAITNNDVKIGFMMRKSSDLSSWHDIITTPSHYYTDTEENISEDGEIIFSPYELRTLSSCGYIIYAPKESSGIGSQDFFIMAFNKKGFID